jgi:transposase
MEQHHYKRFIGLDIHKINFSYAAVDPQGQSLTQGRRPMADLNLWASRNLTKEDQVVIEATGNSYVVYDQLAPWAGSVVIADALAMHDRTRAGRKTDRLDALHLAHALRGGYMVSVWVPTPEIRERREWVAHRHALAKHLTAARNELRSLLYRHGISFAGADVLDASMPAFITAAELPELTQRLLFSKLRLGLAIQTEIAQMDKELATAALRDEACLKLMTLPGVAAQAALIITSAVGEIKRFETPKQLASYSGLVPSVSQSGETAHYGSITHRGRSLLRWIMVEAANAATLTPGPVQDRYQRLRRHGKTHSVAIVAVARHLLELVWHLLTKQTVFRDARPKYLTTKLRGVLRRAYGRCPQNAAPTLANAIMGWKVNPAAS